jgi:hypothetical protein
VRVGARTVEVAREDRSRDGRAGAEYSE